MVGNISKNEGLIRREWKENRGRDQYVCIIWVCCNMKSVLCDMRSVLCDMRIVLCNIGSVLCSMGGGGGGAQNMGAL